MCGRFTLTIPDYEDLATALGVEVDPAKVEAYKPRYNVAPTDAAWVLRLDRDRHRELGQLGWGLVPWWSKTLTQAKRPINARSETLGSRPAFRDLLATRRCIVVSDGFYEWQRDSRQPFWIKPAHGGLLLLGGLWDSWRPEPGADRIETFTIITTPANADVEPLHDRMPLVLDPKQIERWLETVPRGEPPVVPDDIRAMVHPAADGSLVTSPVSKRVGNVRNDDPSVLVPE